MSMRRKLQQLDKAVKEYHERLAQHRIEQKDGSFLMRWEHYKVQRVIACAAVSYGGYVVTGVRHFCPIMGIQIDAIGDQVLKRYCGYTRRVEGFVCQYGFFLTREEAWDIAKAAGQIKEVHTEGVLYSECYV